MDGIADYRFVRFIGEGGHGAFYLATPPPRLKLDSQVVGIKLLSGLTDEDALRRATRELRAFASAQSPYLVTLLDAGREGSTFFYAMEYCPLGSLESPERPLERRETLIAVAQAARGAHALHEAGLVHRSIKPANVLLVEHGARLADLGLVHALAPTQTVTGLGSIGAVEYVEPDLLTGHPASRASDIWSLGVTLHRALTGTGLYGEMPADDPLLCVRKVLSRSPQLSDALDPAAAAIVLSCLAPSADDRPKDALVLAEDLERLAG
jgi:eukaryotic-like serine/threonine-protein kinase